MQRVHDRVKETSTSTGTTDFTLSGAVTQFQSFSNAFAIGETFCYAIVGQTGSEWEVGCGYLSGATTLVRDMVTESSNSNLKVTFSAGTKDVFCTLSADRANDINNRGQIYQLALGNAMP